MRSLVTLLLSITVLCHLAAGQSTHIMNDRIKNAEHLKDFQVFEFRRYTIKPGQRENFAKYFETYFPEAFQQLGAIAVGEFFERKDSLSFTWIRGFHNMDDRAKLNAQFYFGPVWKEHRNTLNALMTDSDNVLLLRPLNAQRGFTILPAVDPVSEGGGAKGVIVAQIFAVKAGNVDAFAQQAEDVFASYRAAGAREAAVLVTLDAPNNFPQLPVRTDGPYLVWLGVLENTHELEARFDPIAGRATKSLVASGMLRNDPELVVMEPTPRSRLRWLISSPK